METINAAKAGDFAPTFADVAYALKVLKAVESRYHHCPEWFGTNDWTPNYAVVVDDLMAYQSGLCAAIVQADEQDTKKPRRPQVLAGIDKTTEEGSPNFEFRKLQNDEAFGIREDNRVNFAE